MFGFLKKKIKETSEKIAEEIKEDSKIISEDQVTEEDKQELEKEKKNFFKKIFSKKKKEDSEEISAIEEDITEEQLIVDNEDAVEETKIIETKKIEPVVEKSIIEKKTEKTIEKTKTKEKEIIGTEPIKEVPIPKPESKIEDKVEKEAEEVPVLKSEKEIEPIVEEPIIGGKTEVEKVPEEKLNKHNNENIIGHLTKLNKSKKLLAPQEPKEKRILGIFKKKHKEEKEIPVPEKVPIGKEELISPVKEKLIDPTQKKKGIFKKLSEKIVKLNITDEKFDELFWDLEVALMENNVAVEVIEKIKENLKQELENTKVTRRAISEIILNNLRQTIESLFDYTPIDILEKIKISEKPYKILMLGVNGSGKTTTIGKLVKYFQDNNITCVVAAADTFRAAAIQQIEEHTNNLNTKLIKHDYGADPAAVAYDAIEHAKSKAIDVVLIDTAGRLHSNSNLMQELEKIIRVAKPDMKIFIGESITGNDCVEQATQFNKSVGIDSIILTKADVDEKGGVAISISHVTGKPILFITTGQEYKDLKKFNPKEIVKSVFED